MPHQTIDPESKAAAFLNVSRSFVIGEIAAGRLQRRIVNQERDTEIVGLVRYQLEQRKRSADALHQLHKLSVKIGQDL